MTTSVRAEDMQQWMRDVNKALADMKRHRHTGSTAVTSAVTDGAEPVPYYDPVVPSDPIIEQKAGAVSVTWDGTGAGGEVMPGNFDVLEIHRDTDINFEPYDGSRVGALTKAGTVTFTDQTYDLFYYYKFVMVNREGYASAPSAPVLGVATRVGGSDLTADSIDGKTITGATIQTGTTGGRAVLRPGPSGYYGIGSHSMELYTGVANEQYPAELLSIADGPLLSDNISLLIAAPLKTGYLGSRSFIQMFAKDSDTSGFISMTAENTQQKGYIKSFMTAGTSDQIKLNVDANLANGINGTNTGGITCTHPIEVEETWNTLSTSGYLGTWANLGSAGYYNGITWRWTHDWFILIRMGVKNASLAGANPAIVTAGSWGMPLPANYNFTGPTVRAQTSTHKALPLFIFTNGTIQIFNPTSEAYTAVTAEFQMYVHPTLS